MAEVYKFKLRLCELEDYIWRDIEITSLSSVAKLGYAVIAAFDAEGSHLFCIKYFDTKYEFPFEDFEDDESAVNPSTVKLSKLKLNIGDRLTMEYDYGAGWKFDIQLISVTEMKKGTGSHYPYITDGAGRGIIEDEVPCTIAEYIKQTNEIGKLPTYYDFEIDEELEWDYRRFDLKSENILFKGKISYIKDAYESEYYE